ncbi:MAG: hypothetical protein EXQ67_02380 [Thermoleophilia bacterium]|nr:hypothetical protein [Thermoleophilia bacterium]
MNLRIVVFVALIALLIIPAGAAAKSPSIKTIKIYRTPSGPLKGTLTVIATANFSGKTTDSNGLPDTRSLAMIVVTLQGERHSITASDTVRFTRRNKSGQPVRFDIRIPRSASRLLAGESGLNVRATVTRELPTVRARAVRIDQPGASTRGWRCAEAQAMGYTGTCAAYLEIINTPPPAPPVGFEQWQNGGPGQWINNGTTWQPGGDEALLCVTFMGASGYAFPSQYLTLTASNGATVGSVWTVPSQANVPTSGAFTDPSYLDVFVGGYAQVSTGPTLTVQVPTSILSSPVGPSTGNATLTVLPQMQGLPTSWSLSPLTQSEAAGVC